MVLATIIDSQVKPVYTRREATMLARQALILGTAVPLVVAAASFTVIGT